MCLDGLNGDASMSDAEGPGAQDDMQAGEVKGVKERGDFPWCMTAWSAGAEDVTSAEVAKRAGES